MTNDNLKNLKNNQIQSIWGGTRKGSGRKRGVSKTTEIKRKFREYFSEGEIIKLIELAKSQVIDRPEILKFCLEQLFGRAPQKLADDAVDLLKITVIPLENALKRIAEEPIGGYLEIDKTEKTNLSR